MKATKNIHYAKGGVAVDHTTDGPRKFVWVIKTLTVKQEQLGL